MRRGRAIIEARKQLGNAGAIRKRGNDYCVGTDDGEFHLVGSGRNWREAITEALRKVTSKRS